MKKVFLTLLLLLTVIVCASCKESEIYTLSFTDRIFAFDGEEHAIFMEVPNDSFKVEYDGNYKTEEGEYTVTAKVSKKGFKTRIFTAKMTITSDFGEFYFENQTYTYDGSEKFLKLLAGVPFNLPVNVRIEYDGNGKINAGDYTVNAYLMSGQQILRTFTASLVIEKAETIITADSVQAFVYTGWTIHPVFTVNHQEAKPVYSGLLEVRDEKIIITVPESANYKAAAVTVRLIVIPVPY